MPTSSTFMTVYQRDNKVKKALNDFFLVISSYPRLLIEVFTRKQFGQRYFSITSVVILTFLMVYMPFVLSGSFIFEFPRAYGSGDIVQGFFSGYTTWFIYTGLFLVVSIMHILEIKAYGSVFEGKRFSLSTGVLNPVFDMIPAPFGAPRLKEILIEPLPFLILGFILWKFGQNLGMLLMISSVMYSLSYVAAYNGGDNFIMDKMDQIIFNEELENTFVHDMGPEKTRGVRVFSDKPTAEDLRQKIYEAVADNEETAIAI